MIDKGVTVTKAENEHEWTSSRGFADAFIEVLSDKDDMRSVARFCARWTTMWPQLHNLSSGKEDDVSTESMRAVQQQLADGC